MTKGATYDELCGLAPGLVGEILAETLLTRSRPSLFEAFVATGLCADLGSAFQRGRGGPGGWVVMHEPELHLGEDVVVPDLAAWRRERMTEVPDAPYFTLVPDWVCEVISPGTARRDRTLKLNIYAREEVRHYWIVDPRAQTLEVFRFDQDGYRLVGAFAATAKVRAEPFDAIEIDLGQLWPSSSDDGE